MELKQSWDQPDKWTWRFVMNPLRMRRRGSFPAVSPQRHTSYWKSIDTIFESIR